MTEGFVRFAVRSTRGLALVAAALTALMMTASTAAAQDSAACDVYEIEASNDDPAGIDKGLASLESKLKKPPFSGWKRFALVKKHQKNLRSGRAVGIGLAGGGNLSLEVRDVTREKGKKPRLRLSLQIDSAGGKRLVDATTQGDSGDPWLVGGLPVKGKAGATGVIGIVCTAK